MPSPGGASLPGENPKSTGNIRLVWGLPSLSKPGPRTGFNHSCQGHRVQSWDPPIFLPRMPRLQAVIILLLAEELDAKRHLVPLAQVHHTCAGVSLTVASSLHAQEMHWNPAPRALHNEFILPNSIDSHALFCVTLSHLAGSLVADLRAEPKRTACSCEASHPLHASTHPGQRILHSLCLAPRARHVMQLPNFCGFSITPGFGPSKGPQSKRQPSAKHQGWANPLLQHG